VVNQPDDLKRLIASLARTREALHNRRDTNDAKDAQVILHKMEVAKATDQSTDSLPPLQSHLRLELWGSCFRFDIAHLLRAEDQKTTNRSLNQ
jgi:hypothetical protein